MDAIYYKIYKSERENWQLVVVCMQWFDEYDYYSHRFMKDKKGNILKFDEENEAIEWLNENIKPEMVAPEYRKWNEDYPKDEDYFK